MLAGTQVLRDDLTVVVLEVKAKDPFLHEDRLVLDLVILEREPLTWFDDEEFADVRTAFGPNDLVAPRLVHTTSHQAFLPLGHLATNPIHEFVG